MWSPYEKLDPDMKRTFSAPTAARAPPMPGTGNGKAGIGRMEITNSVPSSLIALKLDFEKPFKANNTVDFTLTPSRQRHCRVPGPCTAASRSSPS